MRIVYVRHGAPRASESDPALTSAGHRMAAETGEWLMQHQVLADHCLVTPTQRTRETADGLLANLPHVRRQLVPALPERDDEFEALIATWKPRMGDHGTLLLVGHHPTREYLVARFGPPPVEIASGNYATALVIDPIFTGGWAISACWPGRRGEIPR